MDLEKLINKHNKQLDKRVEKNAFLSQRIKIAIKKTKRIKEPFKIRLRKNALTSTPAEVLI